MHALVSTRRPCAEVGQSFSTPTVLCCSTLPESVFADATTVRGTARAVPAATVSPAGTALTAAQRHERQGLVVSVRTSQFCRRTVSQPAWFGRRRTGSRRAVSPLAAPTRWRMRTARARLNTSKQCCILDINILSEQSLLPVASLALQRAKAV